MDCLRAGLNIKAVPVTIGREEPRESTWFKGYNDKYFFDRGVLFSFLYGNQAQLWALRYALVKKKMYGNSAKFADALRLMKAGIKEGAKIKEDSGRALK